VWWVSGLGCGREQQQIEAGCVCVISLACVCVPSRVLRCPPAPPGQAELADVRALHIPALEAKHKEAAAKAASEVARLKHSLKEAEAAAAAATAEAASGSSEAALMGRLQDATRERERCGLRGREGLCCCLLSHQRPHRHNTSTPHHPSLTATHACDETYTHAPGCASTTSACHQSSLASGRCSRNSRGPGQRRR
jgi:hypothetical protein